MRNEREPSNHLLTLVGHRYLPHHLDGLVALLLFFIALVLGAGVAIVLRSLL